MRRYEVYANGTLVDGFEQVEGYELGLKDGKERTELLQQEPILDKIRAEIEQQAITDVCGYKYIFVNRVNRIIDKYKAESRE